MNLAQVEVLNELSLLAEFELAARTGYAERQTPTTERHVAEAIGQTSEAMQDALNLGVDAATITAIVDESYDRLIARWAGEPHMANAAMRAQRLVEGLRS